MKRAAGAAGIAVLAYVLCLWLGFPQYFAPLAPHHSDLYIPVGLLEHSPLQLLAYPRPVAFEFLRLIGYLGVEGSIAAVIALIIAAVPLTAYAVEKLTGQSASVLTISTYSLLLFAHPEFYFQHRHDVPAALSYLLMLSAVLLWWRGSVVASCGVLLALGLTQRNVYTGHIGSACRRRVAATPQPACLADALCYRCARARRSVQPVALPCVRDRRAGVPGNRRAARGCERILVLPGASVHAGSGGARHLFVLAVARRCFHARWARRAGAASVLPNHLIPEYAWVAAPLVFAPILTATTRRMIVPVAAGTAITLASYAFRYDTPGREWAVAQERRGLVSSLRWTK